MCKQENLPHRELGRGEQCNERFREKRTKTDARRRKPRMIERPAVPKQGMGRPATGELCLGWLPALMVWSRGLSISAVEGRPIPFRS